MPAPRACLAALLAGCAAAAGIGVIGSADAGATAVSPSTTPAVTDLNTTETSSGDGLKLSTEMSGLKGHTVTMSGSGPVADAGAEVAIQMTRTPGTASSWTTKRTVDLGSAGTFSTGWTPGSDGQFSTRAILLVGTGQATTTGGGGLSTGGPGSTDPETGALKIDVFTAATATLYGPGLWGNKTACGEKLSTTTIGVANRTLKCGTRVAIDYDGSEIVAPVIDRGPYGTKAKWDLTMATAKALGIESTSTIATLSPAPK